MEESGQLYQLENVAQKDKSFLKSHITSMKKSYLHYFLIWYQIPTLFTSVLLNKCNSREKYGNVYRENKQEKCVKEDKKRGNYLSQESISSVQFSCSVVSDSLWSHGLQHTRPPCPSPTPGVHSNPCALSQWCHPPISSSVIPVSSCLQSFPASRSFLMNQFFPSGQCIGVSASASVLSMNIQDWFPLGWTGLISLQAKGLPREYTILQLLKTYIFNQNTKPTENPSKCSKEVELSSELLLTQHIF